MKELFLQDKAIRTDTVVLRGLKAEDAAELTEFFDCPLSPEKTAEFVQVLLHKKENREEAAFVILDNEEKVIAGILEIFVLDEETAEIGYRIKPAYRNQRYASEAVCAIVQELMDHTETSVIYAKCEKENEYSERILKHNGFELAEEKDGILICRYERKEKEAADNIQPGLSVIVAAGGCFWGTEKVFQMLDGVIETKTGYANGSTEDPHYEEVCRGNTGFKEAVRVIYDPVQISLEVLMEAYFLCVDPTLTNRQGNDIGTQYQTGIYYIDPDDREKLENIFAEKRKEYREFHVELEPLRNFYSAEEYHQKYLDKNPYGYCHITRAELEEVRKLNERNRRRNG